MIIRTCPYYKLVKKDRKNGYATSEVTHDGKSKTKAITSLLKNEHPCEYAIFLTEFLKE